jgi:transcription elongation factor SPT6
MHQIFGDGSEFDWAMNPTTTVGLGDHEEVAGREVDVKLTDVFELSEVVEKMLTDKDEEVRVTDTPERMQVSLTRPIEPNELDSSSEWCTAAIEKKRLLAAKQDKVFKVTGSVLQDAVKRVLRYMREDFLEVPFIQQHRRDYWEHALLEEELWLIFDEDENHRSIFQKRMGMLTKYERLGVSDSTFMEALYQIHDEEAVNDLNSYLHFTHGKRIQDRFSGDKRMFRQSRMQNTFETFRTTDLIEFINSFCLKEREFIENLRAGTRVHVPLTPSTTVVEAMTKAMPKGVNLERYRSAFVDYLAMGIFHHPEVRRKCREEFELSASISIVPTEAGNQVIIQTHPYFKFKYLKSKPLKYVVDDVFLDMIEAEEKGLIRIEISFEKQAYFASKLSNAWLTRSVDDWNELRIAIFKSAEKKLIDHTSGILKERLLKQSQLKLASQIQENLFSLINRAPYQARRRKKSSPIEFATVLSISLWVQNRDVLVHGAYVDNRGNPTDFFTDQLELAELDHYIGRYDPEVIVIGASQNVLVYRLIEDIKSRAQTHQVPVEVVPEFAAKAYQESISACKEFPDFSLPVRKCIFLARQVQDPLHALACLFPKDILKMEFHKRQSAVPEEVLKSFLQRAMIKCVARTGVDVNDAMVTYHLSHTLQFVCGLGPRKASGILHKIQNSDYLKSREGLILRQLMARRVFLNCASYIRITQGFVEESEYDPLDDTRIHPEDYSLARKMTKDALEIDEADDDDTFLSRCIEELWHTHKEHTLDELSLEDYARVIEEQMGHKKRLSLEAIKVELKDPFREMRPMYAPPSDDEVMAAILGSRLERGKVVKCTVTQIREKFIRTRLENGFSGIIWPRFASANRDFANAVKVGQELEGVIQEVDMGRLSVSISILPGDIENALKLQSEIRDPYFDHDKLQQDEKLALELKKKNAALSSTGNSLPAVIKHPLFRPFNTHQAMLYLSKKHSGEAVVRPNSNVENQFCISWVVLPEIIQHLDVVFDTKSSKYYIKKNRPTDHRPSSGEFYHDIDEILFRYIEACASQVEKVTSHRKYEDGLREKLEHKLTRDIKAFPNIVAYGICPNHIHPGYFYLLYLRQLGRPSELGFKVVPKGFSFLGKEYSDLEQVINAFKSGINNPPR